MFLTLTYGVRSLLPQAAVWSGQPLEAVLKDFPERMLPRCEEIEVSRPGLQAWASMFQ